MKKHILIFIFISCTALISFAQVPLASFVGTTHLPADGDAICAIPMYPEISSSLEEPLENALVHDFKLFTLDGDSVQLSSVLNDLKPVLLIGCSYTCYVYRGKMEMINDIEAIYGNDINIYIVYTVEAHPVIDMSPYFGYENVGADNYAEGILYRQPTTYGERKMIVSDMLDNMDINVPVLIDGPCNEFWLNYGTAPNPAWLISPDGTVYDAQKWFNKEPDNMYASIDSLLGIVGTGAFDPEGSFNAVDEGEPVYYGTVENTIAAHITFTNTSDDNVLIDFTRTNVDVPAGWFTSLCTDLCYSPGIDSTTVFLTPGQTEIVRIDFFTDHIPAGGSVQVECINHFNTDNSFYFTINAESIAETPVINFSGNTESIHLSPNPVNRGGEFNLNYQVQNVGSKYIIYSASGVAVKQVVVGPGNIDAISTKDLNAGAYFIRIFDNGSIFNSAFVVL